LHFHIYSFYNAFNGRFDIYFDAIEVIKNTYHTGIGVGYANRLNGQLAHNWILECLLQAGVINLVLVVLSFSIIIFRFWKQRDNCLGYLIGVVLTLIQGMVEPNLFAFSFDFFFWMLCGFGMSTYRKERRMQEFS